ncbi:NUDIX domain-containing protein [Bacillus cytotoxicus]|uniref:NUDIX domain-containing protein n=1 Tax=Bacillus cytotoxicus TaxID=580165 RepID=A0ACC6AAR6_9BACI|nr:NUDIX domain-containing protein [Bacillus cytotoxicus]
MNVLLGISEIIDENNIKINYREAVRAIIMQDNKILLVHSNLGDYIFPGGGVEKNETHAEGLIREVAEETGYLNCVIKNKMGVVVERYIDEYDENAIFQMTSHYYFCELNGEKTAQKLEGYELEQGYTPQWVKLGDAINQNEKIINQCERNWWIHRENYVLKELEKMNLLYKRKSRGYEAKKHGRDFRFRGEDLR